MALGRRVQPSTTPRPALVMSVRASPRSRRTERSMSTAVPWSTTARLGWPWLGVFAAEERGAVVVLVEAIEDWFGDREGVLVAADHGQAAEDRVEAGGLGGVVAFVVEVGLVDDLGDLP